jgi:hypothetical protein
MLGDLEMHGAEAVSGEGTSQSDSKYFHVFQNGACYEFALNVTTNAAQADASLKHIDRDKVFARLQSILSSVKIDAASADQGKVAEKKDGEKQNVQTVETSKTDASAINAASTDPAKVAAERTDAPKPVASTEAAPSTAPTPIDPAPVAAAASATPAPNVAPQ